MIIPFFDRMVKIDLRVMTMDVPPQDVITKDNVTVRVNAVVYFRVIDPEASVVKVLGLYTVDFTYLTDNFDGMFSANPNLTNC